MFVLSSIAFIIFGVIFFCYGLTGPVCQIHGDEGPDFMAAGAVNILFGTIIAFIGIAYCNHREEKETSITEAFEEIGQEDPVEEKDDEYFYNMLMEDDEAYEKCVKGWQNHAKTYIPVDGETLQIPDAVIEDVMSEREIVFPKRVGES